MNIEKVYHLFCDLTPQFPSVSMVGIERVIDKCLDEGLSSYRYNQLKEGLTQLKSISLEGFPDKEKKSYEIAKNKAIALIEENLELFAPSNS